MLDDKELKALIRLLDDEDPEVSEHVWSKLTSIGVEGIDRLEAEWEIQDDPTIQNKIEDLIEQINSSAVSTDLLDWRKGGGKDLLEGWLLLTKYHFPDLDLDIYKNEVNRLVNKTWLEVNSSMDAVGKVRVLNHILFVMEAYTGNRHSTRYPQNSLLNYLVDQKQGNAFSTGLLYLIIARKLQFPVYGVILPGYFVLFFKDGEKEFYIDPFNGGAFFTKNDLKRFIGKLGIEDRPSFYKPTSNIYIILEIIKTMISDYEAMRQPDKAEQLKQLLKDIEIRFD